MSPFRIRIVCRGDNGRGHESRTANVVQFYFGTEAYDYGWNHLLTLSRAQRPEKRDRHVGDPWNLDAESEEGRAHVRRLIEDGSLRDNMKRVYACTICRDNLQVSDWERLCRILDTLRDNGMEELSLAGLRRIYETHRG